MKETMRITRETLIPIGLVITIVIASVYFGSLANKVEAMEKKDSPSRTEFDSVNDNLIYIRGKVDEIVKQR